MSYFAHSARWGRPAQLYADHIQGVVTKALINVENILEFAETRNQKTYKSIIKRVAFYHDLGKLNKANQKVLSGKEQSKNLPVEHRDAGIKHLLGSEKESPDATLIYAHHSPGLPDLAQEMLSSNPFRYSCAMEDTNRFLSHYLVLHKKLNAGLKLDKLDFVPRLSSLEYRVLLSCLVDADYSDSARVEIVSPARRWAERLARLDSYVAGLSEGEVDYDITRNEQRRELYQCCKNRPLISNLEFCDSPVGTGKTTAVMARALKAAENRNLRRIFVVLPFTNIISQTVDVLRKALVLEGEDPWQIVAEHHHQADFESVEYRHLATTWSAPIVVTTAVQFFETLASNIPAKLRKLHQLPGSCVVIDESHAVLPPKLMPAAWRWLTDLTSCWGCYVCLCSGTAFKFWENDEFKTPETVEVAGVLTAELAKELEGFEQRRLVLNVQTGEVPHFRGIAALMDHLEQFPGPRLVVLNTVRNAAYLAKALRSEGKNVLHLSTALSPSDRERVLEEVTNKLKNEQDWTLVATSCVECGMDFSFRNGFCELRSVQSYLQLAGRVNRNGEYENSSLNCFTIVDDNFNLNPSFEIAQSVFRKLIERDALNFYSITEVVSKSFSMECKEMGGLFKSISKADRKRNFASVAELFKVISEDTITVVVDPALVAKVKSGQTISSRELQRGSVNMRKSVLEKLGISTESELPFLTADQYDDFLGYMKGIFAPFSGV